MTIEQKTCTVCGKLFGRTIYKKGRETPGNFARRKACSVQCGYESISVITRKYHEDRRSLKNG